MSKTPEIEDSKVFYPQVFTIRYNFYLTMIFLIMIKPTDDRLTSWTLFLNPLSSGVWIVLIIVVALISLIFTGIEVLFDLTNEKFYLLVYLKNLWIGLKANFGGKPSSIHKINVYQIVLFTSLLVGSLIWISYRASFTSELSVVKTKLPFDDLETLFTSDYK